MKYFAAGYNHCSTHSGSRRSTVTPPYFWIFYGYLIGDIGTILLSQGKKWRWTTRRFRHDASSEFDGLCCRFLHWNGTTSMVSQVTLTNENHDNKFSSQVKKKLDSIHPQLLIYYLFRLLMGELLPLHIKGSPY